MLIMQLSTQTDNYMYRKSVATKKITIFEKMTLKFRNPKFNIFLQSNFYKMQTLCNSEVNKVILKLVIEAVGLWLHAFQETKTKPLKQN